MAKVVAIRDKVLYMPRVIALTRSCNRNFK
jgi:hypothetical protein